MLYDKKVMTLLHRRLLVLALLLVFAVSAPAIILYAAGYRYNTRLHRIEQLGLLYVTTVPNGTKLTVDGQSYSVNKELVVDDLRAGTYDITISKDGYHSWSKQLDIASGQSTFVRNLNLFKDTDAQPREIFVDPLSMPATTAKWMVFAKSDYLFAMRREPYELTDIALPSVGTSVEEMRVDDTADVAVFRQGQRWYRASLTSGEVTSLSLPAGLKVAHIIPRDAQYFLLTDTEILRWNTSQEPQTLVKQLAAQDVYPGDGGTYWIISKDASAKRAFLYELPSQNGREVFLTSFPYGKDIRIADVDHRFLTIADASNAALYLVDAQPVTPVSVTLNGVHTFAWSRNHEDLLTATDFELAIQHVSHGKTQEILTRLSTPILDAAWDVNEQQVFFVTSDGLFAIERDARDKRNVYHLVSGRSDIRLLNETPEGNDLLFASTNQGSGYVIWELPLR